MTAIELIKQRLELVKKNLPVLPPNKFQVAEQEGRDLFSRWCLSLKMVPQFDNSIISAYDAYDAICNNNFYEIKYKKDQNIDSKMRLFENEGIMLEEQKMLALRAIWLLDPKKEFFYWMAFEDKTIIHKINFEKNYKVRYKDCPTTTVGDKTIIAKRIYMIQLKDCSITPTIR